MTVIAGSISPVKLQKLQSKLEQTKTTLESANQASIASLTRDDILGDMFYAGVISGVSVKFKNKWGQCKVSKRAKISGVSVKFI